MLKTILCLLFTLATFGQATAATPSASFDAGSVHVDQFGSGARALVLIPGLSDSGKVWDSTVARYQASHLIYVLTLPGFGGRPKIAAPMIDSVVRDIVAFLPRANRPVVIGHSLGGILAIRIAEEHSDLISGAVAIDGLPVFAGLDNVTPQMRATIADQGAGKVSNLSPAQFAAAQKSQLEYMTQPANVDTAASFSEGADIGATAEYLREVLTMDLRPGLASITVPLLEIAPFDASVDPINPFSPKLTLDDKKQYYQKLLSNDPKAQVVMIDRSRHFIMLDQPAALFAAIDAFLATL
jgi:pimeloyl-ACP methyl ester carboxylesterase